MLIDALAVVVVAENGRACACFSGRCRGLDAGLGRSWPDRLDWCLIFRRCSRLILRGHVAHREVGHPDFEGLGVPFPDGLWLWLSNAMLAVGLTDVHEGVGLGGAVGDLE